MKLIKHGWSLLAACILLFSCTQDSYQVHETEDLVMVLLENNGDNSIVMFTNDGQLTTGPSQIYLQFLKGDEFLTDAQPTWEPVMTMGEMSHGCPHSNLEKSTGKETLYEGNIDFNMAGEWDLIIQYNNGNVEKSATIKLDIKHLNKQQ